LANGKVLEVGESSPAGAWAPFSPEFEQLFPELDLVLRKACVTSIVLDGAKYHLFSWVDRDGISCSWLSPEASVDPPVSVFAEHRVLLTSFGGIVERSHEPDWWLVDHNDALTELVARKDATFLKDWDSEPSVFEGTPIPIEMEQFYVIAEEVNANCTLCHRLTGEIVLFAHDHLFDHVKRYPGCPENTLYRLPTARHFRDWVNAIAFQWRTSIDAIRF